MLWTKRASFVSSILTKLCVVSNKLAGFHCDEARQYCTESSKKQFLRSPHPHTYRLCVYWQIMSIVVMTLYQASTFNSLIHNRERLPISANPLPVMASQHDVWLYITFPPIWWIRCCMTHNWPFVAIYTEVNDDVTIVPRHRVPLRIVT